MTPNQVDQAQFAIQFETTLICSVKKQKPCPIENISRD